MNWRAPNRRQYASLYRASFPRLLQVLLSRRLRWDEFFSFRVNNRWRHKFYTFCSHSSTSSSDDNNIRHFNRINRWKLKFILITIIEFCVNLSLSCIVVFISSLIPAEKSFCLRTAQKSHTKYSESSTTHRSSILLLLLLLMMMNILSSENISVVWRLRNFSNIFFRWENILIIKYSITIRHSRRHYQQEGTDF